MVICDTNIISKYLERVPKVVENIEAIGTDNSAITPVILIEGITPYTKKNKSFIHNILKKLSPLT